MTRRTAAIVFVTLCVVLVAAAVTLNIGWIYVNGRSLLPLVLGVVAFALIIAGIIVYTVFLVRELHRNDQQDAFLNAVTHELKTPIASIRLYLETLQAREISDAQREEFYRVMLDDTALGRVTRATKSRWPPLSKKPLAANGRTDTVSGSTSILTSLRATSPSKRRPT